MPSAPLAHTTPVTPDLVRGALDLEETPDGLLPHRLPARARAQNTDGQLAMAESQPSGVRLAFRTRATVVELATVPTKRVYVGAPPRPEGLYDLLVDGRPAGQASATGGNTVTIDMSTGDAEMKPGPAGAVRFDGLPGADKTVEIWLPYNEITALVELRTDAPVEPAPPPGAAPGCTMAAPSATAPTPRAPRPSGRRSRQQPARWNWSTSASAAAPFWTRSSPARYATRRPT